MNSQEAKQILLLYRPAVDRDDPDFAHAIALAKADPELDAWFQQHCAFQDAASSAFKSIPVPDGLKEQILSERKSHLTLTSRRGALVAACALVVIAFCGVLTYRSVFPPERTLDNTFANYHSYMIGQIVRYPAMDIETNDVQAIRAELASHHHGQSNLVFTPTVDKILQKDKIAGTGGKALDWQKKPVAMICLSSGKKGIPKTGDLFLFIVDKTAIKDAPATTAPIIAQVRRGITSSSWTSGDKTYILAGLGDQDFIKQYLNFN